MSRRLELIRELVERNKNYINAKNKQASISRRPMSNEDKKRLQELRNANIWLKKAEFCIINSMAGEKGFIDTNPNKKPVLGIRCRKCGRVYMGAAMTHVGEPDIAKEIREAIEAGDELFLTDSITLQMCNCEKG